MNCVTDWKIKYMKRGHQDKGTDYVISCIIIIYTHTLTLISKYLILIIAIC
jgi:hypothetical protein